ncbi:MAG: P-loop NTPase fold protein [Pseudomonadota bacterium]
MTEESAPKGDPWEKDLLGFKETGLAFTNLIKSIETEKVISIEAGFGRGKTFFREAWAQHLRQSGEVVIELDASKSDHSGDPVVTLLGALIEEASDISDGAKKAALDVAKKWGALGVKTVARAVLRTGAEEVIETFTDSASDELEDFEKLDAFVTNLGEDMSKAAAQLISAQMAAEKVRKEELPVQIEALRTALLSTSEREQVIVIIDELDRCHPEYTLAFLEAMKSMFETTGFIFCLMVNENYIEALANHRFGISSNDERYLDKFLDLRLRLKPAEGSFETAVKTAAMSLPLKEPFGGHPQFKLDFAAELAGKLAAANDLSMRQVRRILERIELVMRCYRDVPIDPCILVALAFRMENHLKQDSFHRLDFTPAATAAEIKKLKEVWQERPFNQQTAIRKAQAWVENEFPEFLELPVDRYSKDVDMNEPSWFRALVSLGPHYLPSHQAMLDAVAAIEVPQ